MEHFQTYTHTGTLYMHKKIIDIVLLDQSVLNIYTNFKTHVLGTQKKRIGLSQWDGSFEHPKDMFKWWVTKYLRFYAQTWPTSGLLGAV